MLYTVGRMRTLVIKAPGQKSRIQISRQGWERKLRDLELKLLRSAAAWSRGNPAQFCASLALKMKPTILDAEHATRSTTWVNPKLPV